MAIAPSRRPRFFAGLVLLGCWLGWITATFAASGTRAQADADVAATTLQQLAGQIPAGFRGTPLAIRLQDGHCTCAAAEQQWQRLQTQLDAMAGHPLSLPAADHGHGMPELLVLAGNGTAVYAGPMLPAADRCGAPPDALTQWLPALLSADATPLLLPSRCSC